MNGILNKKQGGQVIIILLLLMLVGLSIGLAYTQRSITDVSTSTQAEQSGRAFSAAEAGIQKALIGAVPDGATIPLGNSSTAQVGASIPLPLAGTFAGIEYPPIGRETTAQFWFVDPTSLAPTPTSPYTNSRVDLYYGNEATADQPAVEVSIVMLSNGSYYTKNYYYDSNSARAGTTGFTNSSCTNLALANGILGNGHKFFCKQTIPTAASDIPDLGSSPPVRNCPNAVAPFNCTLILARVRFLYTNENHSLALAPIGGAPAAQFPPQVQIYNATGTSGQSQKQIQAFSIKGVVPPWFDFALFSVNELRK